MKYRVKKLSEELSEKFLKPYLKPWVKKAVKKAEPFLKIIEGYTSLETDEVVLSLVLNTASLALPKGECVEFAPIKGTCGNISLSGNSLPVFKYRVFDKKLMEFIEVTVEVSKPDRIHFRSTIDSITAPDRHGKEVETLDKYKDPFYALSYHLIRYFPFVRGKKSCDVLI